MSEALEQRVNSLEESMQQLAVVQAEQNVLLRNVLEQKQTEQTNEVKITELQTNWKWLKILAGSGWIVAILSPLAERLLT